MKRKLAVFGAPSSVGGAATKIRDLIRLLRFDFDIGVYVAGNGFSKNQDVVRSVEYEGVELRHRSQFDKHPADVALAVCELDFFSSGIAGEITKGGTRLVWSNDMMWEFKGEAEAVREGLVSRVIFVSDVQRTAFHDMYMGIEQRLIPNYVAPESFPLVERKSSTFAIGRLSRPDPVKYPKDFPVFYESLGLEDVCYRVQAWSEELRKKYAWHRFGPEWNLLPANKVPAAEFLSQLDLFVYPLGHQVVESWGRSTVEAMLTGCVPLVPRGHNFEKMMLHGESGFICGSFAEFKVVTQELYGNRALRLQIGRQAAHHARTVLCNEEEHRIMWLEALTF